MFYTTFPEILPPEMPDKIYLATRKMSAFRLETLEKHIVVSFLRKKINLLETPVFVWFPIKMLKLPFAKLFSIF